MTRATREFRVRYEGPSGKGYRFLSTDKRDINDLAKKYLGLVDEKIDEEWVFLGRYDYEDFFRDAHICHELSEFRRKWVPAKNIPDMYTDEKGVAHLVWKR